MFVYQLTGWYEGMEFLTLLQGGTIRWLPRQSFTVDLAELKELAKSVEAFLKIALEFYPEFAVSAEADVRLKIIPERFDAEHGTWELEVTKDPSGNYVVSNLVQSDMLIAELAIVSRALTAWSKKQ